MSSANISGRPAGCISIPIEIIPSSNSRHNPPTQAFRHHYSSSDFASSPPRTNSYSKSRFQPRQSPTTAYDRLIKHSEFYDRPLHQEPSAFYSTHSNEDLLSSSINPKYSNIQSQKNTCRFDSDFIHPNKSTNTLRRSCDALNDFPDYRVPMNHHQGIFHSTHDRSRSPASQRGESPTRPPPPQETSQQQQQQQESDFKVYKNATVQPNDQQVPSTDTPARDPNVIALEKLTQIKQHLADLLQQVDAFTGSTRDDRIYKELDEQAVKLMMRCDELIDVSTDIKEKRKEMIRNVQTVVAKLESKVPIDPSMESNSNQIESALIAYDPSINITEQQTSIEQST